MSIELSNEHLLSLTEAAKRLPGKPHVSSLYRWRLTGVHGVKLETVKIGGKRFTSVEALDRFSARTTAAADGHLLPKRTDNERCRAIAQAEVELDLPSESPAT